MAGKYAGSIKKFHFKFFKHPYFGNFIFPSWKKYKSKFVICTKNCKNEEGRLTQKVNLYLVYLPLECLDINDWYHKNTYKLKDTIKRTKDFEPNVTVKNYLYGKMYTYYNPLQKINSGTTFTFDIHPNISFYIFIQDTKHNLLTNHPSLIQGYFNKYEVCKKCK